MAETSSVEILLILFNLYRELQESKRALGEASNPDSTGLPPELPPGILGLEIPPEVKSALQVCLPWVLNYAP